MRVYFAAALALIWSLTTGASAPVRMTPVKVTDGVYMLEHSRGSGNSTVIFTDDGVVVISITPIRLSRLFAKLRTRRSSI